MKLFLRKILAISAPVILLLIGVNYIGDAARLFDPDYEKNMASILLKGDFVTNISNYDERVFQKELIAGVKEAPNVLVFGSSRTMLINKTCFPKKTVFNNSVSGATIEDVVALYQMYKERGFFPEKIIVGVDPWLLNKNNQQVRWKSIGSYYKKYHNKQSIEQDESSAADKYAQILSLSYFQSSLANMPKVVSGDLKPVQTKTRHNKTNTKITDGSLVYGKSFRSASPSKIHARMTRSILDEMYSIEGFEEISGAIWKEFCKFIEHLKSKHISVEFFMCPYAPLVFDKVEKEYPNVMKTERLVRSFGEEHNIKIHGSFDPYKIGFDETFFYDGMHCTEIGIRKILSPAKDVFEFQKQP